MEQKKSTTRPSDLSRVMPASVEAEEMVLGGLLLESPSYDEVVDIVTDTDFYLPKNQTIFKLIGEMHRDCRAVDMLTVTEELIKAGKLDECGGVYYISTLTSQIASTSHIREHAMIIKEKSILRQAIRIGSELYNDGYSQTVEPEELLSRSGNELEALMENWIGQSNGEHLSASVKKAVEGMFNRVELARRNVRSGVETGLTDLNKITNGWQSPDLIVLAARPAMGKTAFMLHLAKSAARSGTPVTIFSLEMSKVSLADRLILSECDVSAERYRSGRLTDGELRRVEEQIRQLYSLPIYIDDNPTVTMSYIRHRCKILKKQGKCGLILVDYLQLGQGDSKENNREQEVARMSRTAKITAKELEVPFILLSQLNRSSELRSDKKPLLSDLRESGAIEQDADIVCFLHRPGYYKTKVLDPVTRQEEKNYGELIIAKNRNGASGIVKFRHNSQLTNFYDYVKMAQDEYEAGEYDEND